VIPVASKKSDQTTLPLLRLRVRLAWNGLRYRWLKVTGRPALPQALSLEVTRRCIARCIMCNIWKTPPCLPELTAEEWLGVLRSPVLRGLRELDITGGEPFLRKDLGRLFEGIAGLKDSHFPGLRSVAVTTNGFLTEKACEGVRAILGPMEERGIDLVMVCAMDGVGDIHDRIRSFEGGWVKLDSTIRELTALRARHPGLVIGLKTTVIPDNVDELNGIVRYAGERGLFTIISPCILTPNRYSNLDREEALAFTPEAKEKLAQFYDGPAFRWQYHRKALRSYFRTGRMEKPCAAGFNYYFIRSTGDLYPCPLIEARIGNVKATPIEDLLGSSAAQRFRKVVGSHPACRACTEPGLERYALPFEGFHYLGLSFRMSKWDFAQLHRHMGLDKYL
jgi:MoaA/NifB/PqqE/SkfB family radical SAM enzyme